jgi:hypothetical protein
MRRGCERYGRKMPKDKPLPEPDTFITIDPSEVHLKRKCKNLVLPKVVAVSAASTQSADNSYPNEIRDYRFYSTANGKSDEVLARYAAVVLPAQRRDTLKRRLTALCAVEKVAFPAGRSSFATVTLRANKSVEMGAQSL